MCFAGTKIILSTLRINVLKLKIKCKGSRKHVADIREANVTWARVEFTCTRRKLRKQSKYLANPSFKTGFCGFKLHVSIALYCLALLVEYLALRCTCLGQWPSPPERYELWRSPFTVFFGKWLRLLQASTNSLRIESSLTEAFNSYF